MSTTTTVVVPSPSIDGPLRPAPAPLPGASLLPASAAVAVRTVRKFVRTPVIVVGTVQGAMFLLIFRYVFGGAISAGGLHYVDFLVPGFITTGVLFSGTAAAAGVAEDMEGGFLDRLRSLPIPRASVLAGRAVADTALVAWGTAVTAGIGFLVGFRLHGAAVAGLEAFGLCVLFGFVFSWLFIVIGMVSGNAQAAQGMAMIVFPLSFVSSAYVPVATMPGWMRAFAEHQPLTVMVDAVRSLALGPRAHGVLAHSTGHYVVLSLLWSVGLVAVFAPLAVARFRQG